MCSGSVAECPPAENGRNYSQAAKKLNGYEKKIEELQNLLQKAGSGIRVTENAKIQDLPKTIQVPQLKKQSPPAKLKNLRTEYKT